jgi:hypothetical protein
MAGEHRERDPLLNFSGSLPRRATIEHPRMNLSERIQVLIASALWNASNVTLRLSLWTDACAESIGSRAARRVNRVDEERIFEWYAANPQRATLVITPAGASMKRAQTLEALE